MSLFVSQVAFGMDMDIISGKDTTFTEAVALSFHGADVANWQLFHKVAIFSPPSV